MYLLELSLFIYLDHFYHNMICTLNIQFTYIVGKYKVYLYERKIIFYHILVNNIAKILPYYKTLSLV
jgi:hypothetical protein